MPGKEFSIEPRSVNPVDTPYRKICTAIPAPESLPTLIKLRDSEPRSMRGQPPVVWRETEDFLVRDGYGNQWLDWSSGVLVSNAGHNPPRIKNALKDYLATQTPMMTYCFPSEPRALLVEKLNQISPPELDRVFLLSTGSESTEVALKLARTYGSRKNERKRYIVSFEFGFHGRTYGAQLASGLLGSLSWIDQNPYYVQVPFPGSVEVNDKSFDLFVRRLEEMGIDPDEVAGVIAETFQGREAKLMPVEYAQRLRQWCDEHDAALIFDEVQAGFGRTGKMFAFEHYGIAPDLVCCGKGITSTLPLSAVLGRAKFMDQYGPGEMTSTHSGSPLPCICALESINALLEDGLVENSAEQGKYLLAELKKICEPYKDRLDVGGVGLVVGMLVFNNREELKPDQETAFRFCEQSFYNGNLFFSPVGKGYGTIKFCPPLCITREALEDGLYGPQGIKETLKQVMTEKL